MVIFYASSAFAQRGMNALVVESPDIYFTFFIGAKPEWTPSYSEHRIKYRGEEYVIANTIDTDIYLSTEEFSGLESINEHVVKVNIEDNIITICTGDKATVLNIYNDAGRTVLSKTIDPNSENNTDLRHLDKGMYIITIGERTLKYIKK